MFGGGPAPGPFAFAFDAFDQAPFTGGPALRPLCGIGRLL